MLLSSFLPDMQQNTHILMQNVLNMSARAGVFRLKLLQMGLHCPLPSYQPLCPDFLQKLRLSSEFSKDYNALLYGVL